MTQSGQGEEPVAREAREGIVLPSDGGEPLLPGMTGGYGDRRPNPAAPAPGAAYGRTSGEPYDQAPGSAHGQTPGADPGQAYGQAPGQAYGQASGSTYGQAPGAAPGPAYGQAPGQAYGQPHDQTYGETYGQTYGQPHDPSHGRISGQAPGQTPGQGPGPASAPAGGQAWGTPWGPDQQQAQAPAAQPEQGWSAPPAQPWNTPDSGHSAPSAGWGAPESPGGAPSQALPPEGGQSAAYGSAAAPAQPAGPAQDPPTSYYLPPVGQGTPPPPAGAYGSPAAAPLPPAAHDTPGSAQSPVRYQAPGAAPLPSADEGATQYIPAVGPGALPPEAGSESPADATQFLGRAPQGGNSGRGAGPLPPAAGADAEATQYIAPVPGHQPQGAPYGGPQGGDRQPPAEFDNLFRGGPADEPAGATQQMPRFQQPEATPSAQPPYGQSPQPSYAPPGGGRHGTYDDGDDGRGGRGGRRGSRVPVIAAVGIGIAVLGIGAGALLAGGGSDSKEDEKNQPVSATAPASDGSASPSADPAEQQAVALDKLLADSGGSRTTVINAVEDVKSCDNLGQAAKDLRGAAQQRTGLVTQLSKLAVDKLPDHAALTDALTKAWQASASADNHYAAWADQTAGKKGCKKGQARTTGQTQAANRASGTASTEKVKAAKLWNAIAKSYGLTERQPTQL
ncbi:hypothetical protein AB0H86_37635 [Streptomyces sp. NPDC050997]|uniref:hypothetical protein n=1 Tax=Streptomyces sp. NPDC050997 TaxID=3155519 RepID=UPI003442CC37